jgi:murein L,D-transpeptidase YcbB/YkuD
MSLPARFLTPVVVLVLLLLSGPSWAAENERVAAELKTIIDNGEPAIANEDNDERIVEIYLFYASDRDYKPLWVRDNGPKSKAKEVLEVFKSAAEMGLNPANYHVKELETRMGATDPRGLAELELIFTRAFIDFGRDISRGRITPQMAGSENAIISKELGALTLIDGAEAADSIAKYVAGLEPQTDAYRRLKKALATYRGLAAKGDWPVIPAGKALKPGASDQRIPVLWQFLSATGDLEAAGQETGNAYSPDLVEAVKRFQNRHGLTDDGIVAKTTLKS